MNLKNPRRKNSVALQDFIPNIRNAPIFSSAERIFQSTTDFIRGNPIVSTASVGAGITGLVIGAAAIVRRRKARKKTSKTRKRSKKRKAPKRRGKRSKASIKAQRLRNLAKARRARRKGKRRIIRGPGLGTHEIKHSGKSTKGKMKLVSFRNKKTGKMVRFKVRR